MGKERSGKENEDLEERVETLEAKLQKMLPGRREVLAGGAAAGAGLLGFGAGQASADGLNDGDTQWGSDSNRDDYVADHGDFNSVSSEHLYTDTSLYDAVVWTDGSTFYAGGTDGALNSGTDAATVIQSALDHPVDDNRDTGRIAIAKGSYGIGSTIDVREGVRVDASEGTELRADADTHILNILPDAQWSGGTINCRTGVGFTSDAVRHEGTDSGGVQHGPRNNAIVENLFIQLPDTTGTAVHLTTQAVDTSHVTWCIHHNVSVFRGEYGFHLDPVNAGSGTTTWTNANFFNECTTFQTVRSFEIASPTNTEADGNTFQGCQVQAGGNSVRALYVEGRNNLISEFFPWDWNSAGSTTAIEYSASSERNRHAGLITRTYVTDAGTNSINGYSEQSGDPNTTGKWNGNAGRAENLGVTVWDTSVSPAVPYLAKGGNWIQIG